MRNHFRCRDHPRKSVNWHDAPRTPTRLQNAVWAHQIAHRISKHPAPGRDSARRQVFRPIVAKTAQAFQKPHAHSTTGKRHHTARIAVWSPSGALLSCPPDPPAQRKTARPFGRSDQITMGQKRDLMRHLEGLAGGTGRF